MAAQRGYRTIKLGLRSGIVPVYTSPKTADALEEIAGDMSLYHGVRLSQILEAVYSQGKKDGAREVFDTLERRVVEARKQIPHANPGRPPKGRR
jgi:hypothetical protein